MSGLNQHTAKVPIRMGPKVRILLLPQEMEFLALLAERQFVALVVVGSIPMELPKCFIVQLAERFA